MEPRAKNSFWRSLVFVHIPTVPGLAVWADIKGRARPLGAPRSSAGPAVRPYHCRLASSVAINRPADWAGARRLHPSSRRPALPANSRDRRPARSRPASGCRWPWPGTRKNRRTWRRGGSPRTRPMATPTRGTWWRRSGRRRKRAGARSPATRPAAGRDQGRGSTRGARRPAPAAKPAAGHTASRRTRAAARRPGWRPAPSPARQPRR